ncbi:MAG: hypothetical protein DHS20C17_34680 [Cyclobacteriaceae bacterium]|nr:MAG: hypothetical protein DHS20C17_34680 [Cyclobacteriaceae bacterium]
MHFRPLVLFILFALASYITSAQAAQDTITKYDPTDPTHLIIEYEQASQSLLDIKNKLLTGFNIEPIRLEYQAIRSRLDIYQRIGESHLEDATLSRMNDLISIFERQLANVASWQTSLVQTTKQLSDYRIELSKHINRLSVDQDSMGSLQLQYYHTRHVPLLKQADSLNQLVELKLEEVLDLEYQISKDYSLLYNRIQLLKSAVAQYWDNLMRKEKINWKATGAEEEMLSGSKTQFSNTAWRIIDFFKVNLDRVVYLLVILFGAFLFLRHYKVLDQKIAQEPESTFYKYPLATSILLAGMLFPVIFPPTTSLMYDFALLASYLPFLFILKGNLEPVRFRSYLIFFVFLLVLKTHGILSGTSGFIAILTVVCGGVFVYTIYSQSLRKYFKIRWKWVKAINWLLCIIILIGLISVLSSRVRLGLILINGAAETIALGLILLYFANWSDRLINYIKKRPFFKFMAKDRSKVDEFWHTWSNRIYLILLVIFVISFLKNFSLYSSAKDGVLSLFNTPRVVGELTFTYGGIALFLLVIYVSSKLSSTVKFLTEEKSFYKNQKETANVAVIVRFFLITVGFVLALLVSGIPVDRITIILGALSVGIGFGLQNIVNNLISGIILIFERPIQTGDLVELQQYTGFVKDIGIRASVIRTYDGAEVIVPNGDLVSQEVINWTLSSRERRVEMHVGVAYGSDVKQVTKLISDVLKSHPKVEKYPEPAVLLDGFGDSSVDFRCLIWTTDIDHWLRIKSELSTQIYDALNEADITIPFPQRDLHVVSWTAKAPESVSRTLDGVKPVSEDDESHNSKTGFEKENEGD